MSGQYIGRGMWFQEISILPQWKIPKGRGSSKPNFLKESIKLNWKFISKWVGGGGGGIQTKKTFHWGSIDISWKNTLFAL